MENKYYTPSIEEFHVGFEYEIWADSLQKYVKQVMSKEVLEEDSARYWFMDEIYDEDHPVRVKYLDKEDIESLGFKCIVKEKEYPTIFEKKDTLILVFNDFNIVITDVKNSSDVSKNYKKFSGTIKNKSELEQVLKMIDIE